MFTFNGSSRKPRVVNLSGRKSAAPSRGPRPSQSASLANAQKERAEREAERRQLKAASNIQRVWRGRRVVGIQRAQWRREWDEEFGGEIKGSWTRGIALFLAFNQRGFGVRSNSSERIDQSGFGERRDGLIIPNKGSRDQIQDPQDFERIKILISLVMDAIKDGDDMLGGDPERSGYLLGQFTKLLVKSLHDDSGGVEIPGKVMDDPVGNYSLGILPWLVERLPRLVDAKYYQALSRVTSASESTSEMLLAAVLKPLCLKSERATWSYTVFAANYLITPELPERLGAKGYCMLQEGVDIEMLLKAMESSPGAWIGAEIEGRLWLLSYVIDFLLASPSRKTIDLTGDNRLRFNKGAEEQRVLSPLLASVSGEVSKRIDIEDMPMGHEGEEDSDDEDSTDIKSRSNKKQPLPPFVKSRLEGLIQQSSVATVFSQTKYTDFNDARVLAGFALTLLLVFPRKSQDVRMWLCLAETSDGASAVRFLWEAVRRTSLYLGISRDYKIAVESLKRRNTCEDSAQTHDDDEEWNLILLFVELYGFLLMVMDDDEFFGGGGIKDRQLPLKEVGEMSVFLKNLAFAMYWSGGEIIGEDKSKTTGGEIYFKAQSRKGWGVDYLRAQATTLLKQIYTRDSRRRFLPKGHWLMTGRFDMEGFIPSVVQEEENRHQIEVDGEETEEEDERQLDPVALAAMNPIERRNLRWERMKRGQRRQQRNNYLATIAPRLEILKNLPFFIPFPTRVQIFRQFVLVDQKRRRGGFIDPDQWRAAVLSRSRRGTVPRHDESLDGHDMLSRHHATIHRNRVFEDAYKQFWPLGERLKEPIQITFVDQFGTEEAGIDGGGVTKEFLTGVCGEAFTPAAAIDKNVGDIDNDDDDDQLEPGESDGSASLSIRSKLGQNLFLENEQHLLYANPTSIEELKEELYSINYPDIEKGVKRLLRRYEFLGRVVGKCLYEGILVDVAFAGFFLLRWSQQASATASVGVNDLRDLDEDLYRGLVNLKNYSGDVEADFALNFTITSRLPSQKTITIELKPGGEKIPVTNTNKLEYIHLVSRYRLSGQAYEQTAAFLKGLSSIIKPSWLSMFNQTELQTLVGGDINTPIDVEDLRRNTIYGGVYQIGDDGEEHPSVQLFWEVMRELDDSERRKVLKFVTSVARAPLLGFGILRPRFSIRDAGEDQTRLCSASTCVNLLKMPRYKDHKILKEKLLYSVNSNAGFDLS